ncbi:MAG: tail fiber domain-containing protein [Chitinophagales bacterium]
MTMSIPARYCFTVLLCFVIVVVSFAQNEILNPAYPVGTYWKLKGNFGTASPTSAIGFAANNNFIGTTDATDFVIATNNLERMRFSDTRHMIGIGQQNPQFMLDMTINPDAIFPCTYNGIRINNPGYSNACGNGMFLGFDNSQLPATSATLWNFLSTGYIKFGLGPVGTAEKMRLTSNGLGINVTSPATQLHITENTGLRNGMMVSQATSPNNDGVIFGLDISSINMRDAYIWNYIANGDIKFGTQNTERMRIDLNGNVGIATPSPQRMLHVANTNSTVRVDGISNTGTFSTAPTTSNDRFVYADANGDLKAMPLGSSGQILAINGSGVPNWTNLSSNNWSITGNASTVDGTNFIGTTDDVPFNIRVNNQKAGRISVNTGGAPKDQTFLGYMAGYTATANSLTAIGTYALRYPTGVENTAVGVNALYGNAGGSTAYANTASGFNALANVTTAYQNTAMGHYAMGSNTTGNLNSAYGAGAMDAFQTGNNNTAIGFWAMRGGFPASGNENVAAGYRAAYSITSGSNNVAIGAHAMFDNTTGNNNVAVGDSALTKLKSGNRNVGVGKKALYSNTTADGNTAVGNSALTSNNGTGNTAVGDSALAVVTSGIRNTAIGSRALLNNTGSRNTATGAFALYSNTSGSGLTAAGDSALYKNTTGTNQLAVGASALKNMTSGNGNIAIGSRSLYSGTAANGNIAIGDSSLYAWTGSGINTAVGTFALMGNTTGTANTAIGYNTLSIASASSYNNVFGNNAMYNATGSYNCAFGDQSLPITTGAANVGMGNSALYYNTSGGGNTAIGEWAGRDNTTGNYNTFVGRFAMPTTGGLAYATAIGAYATVSTSNSIVLGTTAPAINVGIGTTGPVYTLDATGSNGRTGSFVNTATFVDNIGAYGSCNNTPNYGYGGLFNGGYIGVYSTATLAGTGTRYGVLAYGWSGSGNNYGSYFWGSGGTNAYGVYASASGATTSNWAGYFSGAVFGTSYTTSDRKLKDNIQPLTNAVDLVKQLNPTTYTYKTTEYKQMNLCEGLQYGLLADEVEKVVPSAVKKAVQPATYKNGDEKSGEKLTDEVEFNALNYTEMIPILIGAVKEQQQQIEELKKQNELLKKQVENVVKK